MENSRHLLFFNFATFILLSQANGERVCDTLALNSAPFTNDNTSLSVFPTSVITPKYISCGGTLTAPTGGIVYKPFRNISFNERCVWFIKPPSAKSFTLKAVRLGFPLENNIGVHIAAFHSVLPELEQYSLTNTESVTFSDVGMLVVTFFSGNESATADSSGFILEYTSSQTGHVYMFDRNIIEVSQSNIGFNTSRHPVSDRDGNKELTLIIFKPTENTYHPSKLTDFAFGQDGSRCNNEEVTLLEFTAGTFSSLLWIPRKTTCEDGNVAKYTGEDLVLILLEKGPSSFNNFSVQYCSEFPESKIETAPEPSPVVCGGTLTHLAGVIVHKPGEQVEANERCVWIIKPPSNTYTLKVHRLGFPTNAPDIGLHVTIFSRRLNQTDQYLLTNESSYTLSHIYMFMVTFFSGNETDGRHGFILEYTSTPVCHWNRESSKPLPGSVLYISNANNGSDTIRHPSSGVFQSWEISPIMFALDKNIYNPSRLTNLSYSLIKFGFVCTHTNVELFAFNSSVPTDDKWTLVKRLCYEDPSYKFESSDLVLMVFQNGELSPSTFGFSNVGFQVEYRANQAPEVARK